MCKQLGAFLTWRENPSPALNASQACIYLPCHLPSMSLVCGTRPFPKELTARAVWSRGRRAFNQFTDQKPDQFDAWFTQAGTGVPGGGTLAMANPQPPAQALPPPPWAESCQLELDESWSSSTRSSTAWNPENAGKKKKKHCSVSRTCCLRPCTQEQFQAGINCHPQSHHAAPLLALASGFPFILLH